MAQFHMLLFTAVMWHRINLKAQKAMHRAVSLLLSLAFHMYTIQTMHLVLWRPAPMPNPPAIMIYNTHQTCKMIMQNDNRTADN